MLLWNKVIDSGSFFFVFTGLVIDGTICYPFNDGTKAFLEVLPEDALLTMKIVD